jgi:hypothetical protein
MREGIEYARIRRTTGGVLPAREEFYVIAPNRVPDKVRGKLAKFDERWAKAVSVEGRGQLPLFALPSSWRRAFIRLGVGGIAKFG